MDVLMAIAKQAESEGRPDEPAAKRRLTTEGGGF